MLEDGSWSTDWQRILACDDWSVLGCYLGAGAVRASWTGTTVLEYSITYGRGTPLGLNAKR